jgi:hypothetical protein
MRAGGARTDLTPVAQRAGVCGYFDRAEAVSRVDPWLSNYQSTLQNLNPAAFAEVAIVNVSGASARPGSSLQNGYFYPGEWIPDASFVRFSESYEPHWN